MTTESPEPKESRRRFDNDTATVDLRWPPTTVVSNAVRPPWYQTPAAEAHVQARGKWLGIIGATVAVLTFIMATIWRQGFHEVMPLEYMLPLYAMATGACSVGGLEYLNRGNRAKHELSLDQFRLVERGLIQMVDLMAEDKKQTWWQAYSTIQKDLFLQQTGTEGTRPRGRTRAGEVVDLRSKRNDSPG